MKEMAQDVKPFLFDKTDERNVLLFPKYMEQISLGKLNLYAFSFCNFHD